MGKWKISFPGAWTSFDQRTFLEVGTDRHSGRRAAVIAYRIWPAMAAASVPDLSGVGRRLSQRATYWKRSFCLPRSLHEGLRRRTEIEMKSGGTSLRSRIDTCQRRWTGSLMLRPLSATEDCDHHIARK
jgi:hypothetical protein